MNVQASRSDFRRAITIASRVLERRNTVPILDGLRCRANGSLEVTGTDLDAQLTVDVPRLPGKDVAFAMLCPMAVDKALSQVGGDQVSLSYAEGKVAVVSGSLDLNVSALPADDFPIDCDRSLDAIFSVTFSPTHIRALGRIAAAISTEETRYYLNGINIRRRENGLHRLSATDGHRLQFIDLALPDAQGDIGNIIIPKKVVGLLRDLAGSAVGDVKFVVGTVPPVNREESTAPARAGAPRMSATFEMKGAKVRLISKLIDGTYPDTDRVIPHANDKPMSFNAAELRSAMRAIAGHSKHPPAVKLELDADGAKVSAFYSGLGMNAAVRVSCDHQHAGFMIGVNGRYLLSMIEAAGGDNFYLSALDPAAPILVKNPADTEWTGVLMPMRV